MSVRKPGLRLGWWFNYVPVAGVLLLAGVAAWQLGFSVQNLGGAVSLPGTFPPDSLQKRRPGATVSARLAGKPLLATHGALPVAFEANQGQTDRRVKYLARGQGYALFLTSRETVFVLAAPENKSPAGHHAGKKTDHSRRRALRRASRLAVVRMRLAGAASSPHTLHGEPLPGVTNYFLGKDARQWRRQVQHYAWVRYQEIYPGVDLAFHGGQQRLEFDFVVAPGASPSLVRLSFLGARHVATDTGGDLVLTSGAGELRLHKPLAYQEQDGVRRPVKAGFLLHGPQVTFALGDYDHDRELVIDPTLSYSTMLGGSAQDDATAVAVDSSGQAYVTGETGSLDFPSSSGTLASRGNLDVFVSRFAADGSGLGYTTLIGGSSDEAGNSIAVDSGGNAYLAGTTASADFPTTAGVLGTSRKGTLDAFAVKLDANGGVAYATYLGGSNADSGNSIAVDGNGNAYVGGETFSTDFPGASGSPIQPNLAGFDDGYVAELNPTATGLVYSTYLGGTSADLVTGIALDASNNAYATGITLSPDFPHTAGSFQNRCGTDGSCNGGLDDAFVSQIKAGGSTLVYSTYLGGSGTDNANGIAVNAAGEAYVTGLTTSSDFPTAHPAQTAIAAAPDAFVAKLNADGNGLVFSTYLGGTSGDEATAIALDTIGDAFVTGRTFSSNGFPVLSAFQPGNGGGADAFVTELSSAGALVYSSYFGGRGNENSFQGSVAQSALGGVAVDSAGNAYLAGNTNSSTGFPTVSPFQGSDGGGVTDAFVAKVGAAAADFALSADPVSVTLTPGSSAGIALQLTSLNSPLSGTVALSCSGLPAGASCGFSPASGAPGEGGLTSTLTLGTTSAVKAGTYSINVTGMAGATSHSTTLSLTVQDFHLAATALSPATLTAGGSATANVTVSPANGFTGDVALRCGGGLPAGVSCSFTPAKISGGSGTSTLTVQTTSSAMQGPATLPIVGTSGATTHSVQVNLALQAAPDFTISATPLLPASVAVGAAGTSTITITPEGGFNADVTLSCSSISPAATLPPQCSFSPASVANGQGTSTLTITTTAPLARLSPPGRRWSWLYAAILPIAGLPIFGVIAEVRRKRLASLVVLIVIVGALAVLPSCGKSDTALQSSANPGTPPGDYTIVVTGSAQSGALTHSISPALTLTVQ
jgi:Beta-propeller repeat